MAGPSSQLLLVRDVITKWKVDGSSKKIRVAIVGMEAKETDQQAKNIHLNLACPLSSSTTRWFPLLLRLFPFIEASRPTQLLNNIITVCRSRTQKRIHSRLPHHTLTMQYCRRSTAPSAGRSNSQRREEKNCFASLTMDRSLSSI